MAIVLDSVRGDLGLEREAGKYKTSKGNPLDFSWKVKMKVVPHSVLAEKGYADMVELSQIFNHEIVEMVEMVEMVEIYRWKPNMLTEWLAGFSPVMVPSTVELLADRVSAIPGTADRWKHDPWGDCCRGRLDLNQLYVDLLQGMFTMEEYMKYQMCTGYSLCGFSEIFGQREADELGLPGALKPVGGDNYTETILDYMLRVHAGKRLKI